jgi:hypothetical protein
MKSEFPYRALLSAHPYFGEFSPARITCPSCGTALRVTNKSRLLGGVVFVSLMCAILLLAQSGIHLRKWQALLVVLGIIAAYYFAFWPVAVRLKPWTPFHYWLPKSRLLGYSVYLLLPVALMALFLYLATKFEVGM